MKTKRAQWERITINVTPDEAAAIKSAAKKDRRSISSYAAQVIIGHIETTARPKAQAESRGAGERDTARPANGHAA